MRPRALLLSLLLLTTALAGCTDAEENADGRDSELTGEVIVTDPNATGDTNASAEGDTPPEAVGDATRAPSKA